MTDSLKSQQAVKRFVEAHRNGVLGSELKMLKRNASLSDGALNPYADRKLPPASLQPAAATDPSGPRPSSSTHAASKGKSQSSTSTAASSQSPDQAGAESSKTIRNSASRFAQQANLAHGTTQSLTVKRGAVHKGASKVADPAHAAVAAFNTSVFNCLSCGKVRYSYDLWSPR